VALEALQAGRQQRAIDFVQQSSGDVHDTRWIDAEQVAVVRKMVGRAERHPFDDGDDPGGFRSSMMWAA
jgi:hypothetical protein